MVGNEKLAGVAEGGCAQPHRLCRRVDRAHRSVMLVRAIDPKNGAPAGTLPLACATDRRQADAPQMKTKMHLAFDLSFTHTDGRWRTAGSWAHRTYPDLSMYEDLARIAERGCIDMLFFGDGTGIPATWQNSEEV